MTWQDAVVKALKEHDRLEFDAKITVVPSKTDERNFHYVITLGKFTTDLDDYALFEPSGPPVCATPCKGFRYRDTCSHVEEVKNG